MDQLPNCRGVEFWNRPSKVGMSFEVLNMPEYFPLEFFPDLGNTFPGVVFFDRLKIFEG